MNHCKILNTLFFSIILHAECRSQITSKPVIDSAAVANWSSMVRSSISNDGRYVMYNIMNRPINSYTLVLQDVTGVWNRQLPGEISGFFSPDSKFFVYYRNKTLFFLNLGADGVDSIKGVESYKRPNHLASPWLCYLLASNNLTVKNLVSGKVRYFRDVKDYFFSPDGEKLLLLIQDTSNGGRYQQFRMVNLAKTGSRTFWASTQNEVLSSYSFNQSSSSLTFSVDRNGEKQIWLYTCGMLWAKKLLSDNIIQPSFFHFSIGAKTPEFTKDGKYICVQLCRNAATGELNSTGADVDVLSYTDSLLPFRQQGMSMASTCEIAVPVEGEVSDIVRLYGGEEMLVGISGDYAIVSDNASIDDDAYWWPSYQYKSYWLVSLKNGTKKRLCSFFDWVYPIFSPDGKFILYFDQSTKSFGSYDIESGKMTDITGALSGGWFAAKNEKYVYNKAAVNYFPIGIAGWVDNSDVIVYDDYDIWLLSLTGNAEPVNLTNSYGRRHHIQLRLLTSSMNEMVKKKNNQPLILSGFGTLTKYSGYFAATLTKKADPILLCMGPWIFSNLQKAADGHRWLVERRSATAANNCFVSKDLRSFTQITQFAPQTNYNWLTSEVVNFTQLDGTPGQGTLYKPEDFDSCKKYPLIFYYYEQLTQNTFNYPNPGLSIGTIDIPWFVSRGYLVFTPDIHYDVASVTGKVNGDYVVNSVIAAAKYMAEQRYVNANKMGINGHSFGGGETLYLVTHSNLFAAACAGASTVSNEILSYLGVGRGTAGKLATSKLLHSEYGHEKIGATLWQRPDLYIRASPVFRADRVTTPLLLMHNLDDEICDFNQSASMFIALRRLGKPVWLLQYDHEGHILTQPKNQMDFTIRLQQFYDHYLKGALPPVWMTKGRPAYLKGMDAGFELDSTMKTPLPLKTYMPSVPNKKPITVTFE
jgi:dienelactone hydrolase/Tol biopolymer transport system component